MSRARWTGDSGDDWRGDDPLDDREGPQECDVESDSDDLAVVPCPACRRDVSELADRCPHCGDWIVQDAAAGSARKPLLIVIAILLLIALLLWVF